jgi:signal transduction histidine kinase
MKTSGLHEPEHAMTTPVAMTNHGASAEALRLLAEAGARFAAAGSRDDALALLRDHAGRLAGADAAVLPRRDAEPMGASDDTAAQASRGPFLRALAERAARQPGPVVLVDTANEAASVAAPADIGAALLLTVEIAGEAAAIAFLWRAPHAPTETEVAALEVLAHGAAAAFARHGFEDRLRAARESFAATGEALRQADRRKDEFLATLAHELRNPLAPISNVMYMLRHEGGRRRADRLLQIVERQVRHIVRLVDDLLEMSRITRGQIALRIAPLPLADALAAALETARPQIEGNRHRLDLQLPDEALLVDGDMVRLTQVFANLLDNAARYTAEGGEIRLAARRDGNAAAVSVRDNGIGIAPELRARIFDLFTRGQRGCGPGGLGVGLTMVKSLVELHRGSIEVQSGGPGKGSEFIVRLPLSDARAGDTGTDGKGESNANGR